MQSIRTLRIAVGTAALLGTALAPAPVAAQSSPNTVTYAMYGDVKDWDPAIAFSLEVMMLVNVYEPLVRYNPPGSDTTLSPALATEWSSSDDGTEWTFRLREDVLFHDGEPFNAAAAKASIERTMEMKEGAWYIWEAVESMDAPDEHTLVIRTSRPAPVDLIASSQYGAYMYSPRAAEQGTDWFNQGNAAGTGPYRVRQWAPDQQVVLEKFDEYWGGWRDDSFERVILRVVLENATQVQMLRSGEADFISLVPADAVATLDSDPDIEVRLVPSWKNSQFLINTQKAPTDNVQFRQALTYLWDYASVVENVYAGSATVARGIIPATLWGHKADLEVPTFDIDRARELLEASGVPAGERRVTMAYIGTSEEYKNAALLFQANAAQVGIEVELLPGPWGTIWDNAKNLETAPNLQSMTWWPTYPTPSDWLIGLFRTEQPALFNLSHYANPSFDALVDEAVAQEAIDRERAIELYGQAQQLLIDDATAIFYADLMTRSARRADIGGLNINPAYEGVFFHRLHRVAD